MQETWRGYWDSPIEESARLFAEWVDRKLTDNGRKNSFLSSGVDAEIAEKYRRMNYEMYRWLTEETNKDLEKQNDGKDVNDRIPSVEIKPYEEYKETAEALDGFVYPTDAEIKNEFDAPLQRLFDTMEEVTDGDKIALNEPENNYGNNRKNSKFAGRYETEDGKEIRYTSENAESYGGLFDFDFSSERAGGAAVDSRTGADGVRLEDNPDRTEPGGGLNRADGEFALVERVFKETGSFNFTSGERIESADDVAYIFSALEDAAKEHSFVVLVKDGKPTVVELGMGSFNATMVDMPTAALAYGRIQPDEVYFVHNHPSGNLICSPQDVQMIKRFEEMVDVPVHGVIINLKTGKYGTFDSRNKVGGGMKRIPESESALTVHSLDKQIFAPDYDPMAQPQVRSSEDVAKFLNSHRMGDRAKVSFLILSRANRIVGNIHTPYTKIPADAGEMARYISERVIQFGGESAILYGDFAIDHSESGAFNKLKQSLQRVGGTNLLDIVNVEGNYTRSANNEGLLYEPGSEYGESGDGDVRLRGGEPPLRGERDGDMVSEVSSEEASGVAEMSGDETDVEAMRGKAEELAGRLNLPVRIVTTAEEAGGLPTVRQRNSKGFYDEGADRRGETAITVVLPNHRNLADVVRTILHEGVWHKGIRLFCKSDAELHNLLDHLYDNSSDGIRAEIDAEADAMYRRTLDGLKRRYGNGAIGEARAFAETERMKREGKFRRDATEEFGARVTEEVKDGEFERMSEDRLGFFGRIVSFVEKAIEKILRGVKIRMPRRYTRGDWKMFSHLFYERLRRGETPAEFKARTGKEWNPVYAEAERVSVRYKEERDGDKNKPTWNETCYALTDSPQPHQKDAGLDSQTKSDKKKPNGKTVAVSDWPSRAVAPGYVPSHSDAAKVRKIAENLKSIYEKVADTPLGANEMVFEVSKALGIPSATSGQSNYVELKIGESEQATTIRVSNHSAKVRNFGRTTNNVGIVIKAGNNRFQSDSGKDYVEFVYYGDKVEGDAERQRAIIDGLRHYIETGSFERMPEADRLNTSGRYRDAIDGLEDAIYFRDGGLGLEETVTKMKVEAAQASGDNLRAKREAMRAIGGNLNHLRQAMARQKEYDITTVKSITDLARVLLENGMLDDLSKYEMKRILGAVNGAVGKEDVGRYVDKVMDIMVDNQLRMGANTFGRLLAVKGSRVDARGVEVQGALDPEGVAIAKVVRKSTSLPKDEIENLIADAVDRMSSTDTAIADEATIEYAGLQLARQYVENIAESKAEEKSLRESLSNEHAARSAQAKESKQEIETLRQHAEAGHITKSEYEQRRHDIEEAERHEKEAFNQYRAATEEAIRQNKIERAEAYHELVEQVGDVMSESIERAKAWREAEKQRVDDIHHNANSDMEGRPTDEHHRDDRVQKLANNSAVRFLLAPLGTFDQMLRMFGKKNVRGEGYLWNRYMRGWVDATETEYTGYRDALKQLDAKVSEVYGKKMKWGDLIKLDRKLPKATVRFMDGGEMKEHVLTQGNLLYIYMADKMTDGRMKLRKMGITESDIEDIKNFLDPHFIELADWMQEEFLVDKRNEYNEVHKRMFGASMAAIENYFPLKILANARMEDVDVSEETTDTALPATSTGSIIKRRRNNLALDVTGANAFSVILDHLQQMEKWAAFAEFNRDLNTLLSYKRFRNQVMNMSSAYGAGKTLWNNFRNVCSMAAGTYRPPIAALDKAAVNIANGVTAAKVSLRVFTALKQFLSMPAYLSDSNPLYIAQNIVNPIVAWRWSMKNLPLFEKRWRSRMAGDPRLMKTDMDWKAWRNNIVQFASRFGMSPNAFVDALTVSIGAHAMYQTKKRKYLRWGMSETDAESRAKQDATILFNQTQQSSEGAFLSTMQVDRSWLSVLFTVFRNSSMSYTRQQFDAIRNLAHRLVPGYGGLTEEFMAKQMRRDGIDPSKADKEARREYRRGIARDIARVAVFGYVLQLAWNMGAYLPYLILGDDDDEKKAMLDDAFTHAMFGSVEGLTGGDVLSAAGQMMATGEGDWSNLTKEMPIAGDLSNIYRKLGNDNVAAMNDVVNLLVQSGIGVNPQSVTDAVAAVIDWCGDDAESGRECALLIARILNCPQSQLDKIYLDELDLTGTEASRMTPAEIAERYARYKVMRGAPLTGWAYSDEKRDSVETKYRNKVRKIAKGKIEGRVATDSTRALLGDYDRIGKRKRELSAMRKAGDFEGYQRGMYELMQTENLIVRNRVGRYKRDIRELTELWLGTKDREELRELTRRMLDARERLLEDVAELEAQ